MQFQQTEQQLDNNLDAYSVPEVAQRVKNQVGGVVDRVEAFGPFAAIRQKVVYQPSCPLSANTQALCQKFQLCRPAAAMARRWASAWARTLAKPAGLVMRAAWPASELAQRLHSSNSTA